MFFLLIFIYFTKIDHMYMYLYYAIISDKHFCVFFSCPIVPYAIFSRSLARVPFVRAAAQCYQWYTWSFFGFLEDAAVAAGLIILVMYSTSSKAFLISYM